MNTQINSSKEEREKERKSVRKRKKNPKKNRKKNYIYIRAVARVLEGRSVSGGTHVYAIV